MKSTFKTKSPSQSRTQEITVKVKDSFANTVTEAKGTVTVHKYSDRTRLVFAKVKTPFGLGTLKLYFHPVSGWSKDAQDNPCSWLSVQWGSIGEVVQALAA